MEKIGIDVHKKESQLCIITEEGEVIEQRIRTERGRFAEVLGARGKAKVLTEASTESEWVARCLEELGHEVVVADEQWGDIHLGPHNALAAYEMLGSGAFLPIHWGTFNLAMHAWDEPAETLASLVSDKGVPMVTPRLGAPTELARVEAFDPWWREVK